MSRGITDQLGKSLETRPFAVQRPATLQDRHRNPVRSQAYRREATRNRPTYTRLELHRASVGGDCRQVFVRPQRTGRRLLRLQGRSMPLCSTRLRDGASSTWSRPGGLLAWFTSDKRQAHQRFKSPAHLNARGSPTSIAARRALPGALRIQNSARPLPALGRNCRLNARRKTRNAQRSSHRKRPASSRRERRRIAQTKLGSISDDRMERGSAGRPVACTRKLTRPLKGRVALRGFVRGSDQ